METVNVSYPAADAKLAVRPLSIITGPSGTGKSRLLSRIDAPGSTVLDLDTIGKQVRQEDGSHVWLTDLDALLAKGPDVIVGTSDNLSNAAKALREGYEQGEPLTVYFVQPSPAIFKSIMAAKAKDGKKLDLDETWVRGYENKARMSPREVEKYFAAKVKNLVARLKPETLVIVSNDVREGSIVNGWDKSHRTPTSKETAPAYDGTKKGNGVTKGAKSFGAKPTGAKPDRVNGHNK